MWQCVKGKGQGTVHLWVYLYSSYAVCDSLAEVARLSQALKDAEPLVFRISTALCCVEMLSVTVFSETGKLFR